MTLRPFPSNPANRRVILLLSETEIERLSYQKDTGKILYDDEAYILPFPIPEELSQYAIIRPIAASGNAQKGTILVQSPFDTSVYEEMSAAPERFALDKHFQFSLICNLLGAKEVSVEQVDVCTQQTSRGGDISVGKPGIGNGTVSVDYNARDEFQRKMNLHDVFEGSPPNLEAARTLMENSGLLSDSSIRNLYEMRRIGANPIKSRKLVLNLSSETQRNLNIAAGLSIPAGLSVSAKYSSMSKKRIEYSITVNVKF